MILIDGIENTNDYQLNLDTCQMDDLKGSVMMQSVFWFLGVMVSELNVF